LVQDELEKKLWQQGQEIIYTRGKMLYYTQDLPFPVQYTPDTFTQFRKEVEKVLKVRETIDIPTKFKPITLAIRNEKIPTLADFGHCEIENDKVSTFQLKGGETEGLKRLKYYLWDSNLIKNYKETRNELIGMDYSSKFSPYLAQGCLSPKQIYHEIKKYEVERGSNESTYWLFFELLWRDFFRLMGKKFGNKIFFKNGPVGTANPKWKNDRQVFKHWMEGRTGVPFIDANMKEIATTGFMSNRGRQNVASFLVNDLLINWQLGAEYFESQLIDYDTCSNWGNWNYLAGIGADPRENRYFNILRQAKMYDPNGDYVKLWLPELSKIPEYLVHQPDILSAEQQQQFEVKLGVNYPKAMISTKKWG
jgi:deoxyribodipyrimidine photo-lyase